MAQTAVKLSTEEKRLLSVIKTHKPWTPSESEEADVATWELDEFIDRLRMETDNALAREKER